MPRFFAACRCRLGAGPAGGGRANDLGLFAEEFDPRSRRTLGNVPRSFVHASFIGAVVDLAAAERARLDEA